MNITSFTKKDYLFNIGDKFIDDNRDLEIVDRYEKVRIRSKSSKEYQKIYVCKCNICGANDAVIEQNHLKSGRGCPVCHGKQVSIGINDIPTTAPWMIDYFQGGYEEAKQYTNQSNAKLFFRCPFCGEIKHNKTSITHLYNRQGIDCVCKDGLSYPEKFMYSLLTQLGIKFSTQFVDDWCRNYRYDFYLTDYNCIIETHGMQHYELCKYNNNDDSKLILQQNIDINKRNIANKNGIKNYFEVDCRFSNKEYISNSIIHSGLFDLLNVKNQNINWNECNEFATSNLVKSVCSYYNTNNKESLTNIAKRFGINPCTVTRYLKRGTELGFCIYNPEDANTMKSRTVKIFNDDGTFDVYNSAKELQDISLDKYGVKLLKDDIQKVCRKQKETYKGFYFEYA